MLQVQAAGLTHAGKKRDGNEDPFFIDDVRQLYVVVDRKGCHLAGEVASGLVVGMRTPNKDSRNSWQREQSRTGQISSNQPVEHPGTLEPAYAKEIFHGWSS